MRIYLVEKVGYVYENDHLSINFLSLTNFPSVNTPPGNRGIRMLQERRDPVKLFHTLIIFKLLEIEIFMAKKKFIDGSGMEKTKSQWVKRR